MKNMPFEKHVDREIYVVDNTKPFDEGIEKLKKNSGVLMKAMNKTIPISWVDFQSKVQEEGRARLRMSVDEVPLLPICIHLF